MGIAQFGAVLIGRTDEDRRARLRRFVDLRRLGSPNGWGELLAHAV